MITVARFKLSRLTAIAIAVALGLGSLTLGAPSASAAATYSVFGQVATAAGLPVVGATVSATDELSGVTTASASTDANGNYQMQLPASTYELLFVPPASSGLQQSVLNDQVISADSQFDLVLEATGQLAHFTGVAQTSDGTLLRGIGMCLEGANGDQCITTDSTGTFRFSVPEGKYIVSANFGGPALPENLQLASQQDAIDLSSGDLTEDLTFPVGQLTLTVLAPDGTPVPGTDFGMFAAQMVPFDAAPGVHMAGTFQDGGLTDSNGTITVPDFPTTAPISYNLVPPDGSGYNTLTNATSPALTGNDNLTIQLSRPQTGPVSTTTVLTSSPDPSIFGQQVTFTATVAPARANGPISGTMSFYLGSPDGTSSLLETEAVSPSGSATFTTTALPAGSDALYAVYGGSTTYVGSSSTRLTQNVNFTSSCITTTVKGGMLVRPGQSLCIADKATINGAVTVQPGGALFVENATINGGITVEGATALRICGSHINGSAVVSRSTGFVMMGDGGDDGPPGCAGNTINGGVSVTSNTAGFEIAGNQVTGGVQVSGNSGISPFTEDSAPEIEGNDITGNLNCSTSNSPTVTDGDQRNSVTGTKSGQCSDAKF